jgi:hypothetical protein
VERFSGVTGAAAKELFERLDGAQRLQAIEILHADALTGLSIAEVTLDGLDRPDQPLAIRWRGRAPGVARASGDGLRLDWLGPPAQLARQFAGVPSRASPLLIGEQPGKRVSFTLVPPAGLAVVAAPADRLDTAFGSYRRREWSEGGALRWEEALVVPLARISPADFPAFVDFAAAVDAAQARNVLLAPVPAP